MNIRPALLLTACLILLGSSALAQVSTSVVPPLPTPHAHRWVLPQMGRAAGAPAIVVTQVDARVEISANVATTTLDVGVQNMAMTAEQAVLLVPVPGKATVTGFTFQGSAAEPTATFMPRDDARRLYDSIVMRERDPALLEWAGWNLLRSSVFPVAPHGTQRVRIIWEELLTGSDGRLDYVLPRSDVRGGPSWTIDVLVTGADAAAVYSPSHELVTKRTERGVIARAHAEGAGAFRLSVIRSNTPSASVVTYPDPATGGGFFLLLAAAPTPTHVAEMRREVTLVLDRSGSMAGAPFERTKAAALQILDGLNAQDTANVIDFANSVSRFSPAPVAVTADSKAKLRAYVTALVPGGGTNIHDALLEALRQPAPGPGVLPAVLFVTDGIPTVGRTKEVDIRVMAEHGNAAHRRVFTIGLGQDINVPLLDRISDQTRAISTYLALKDDDLAARIAEVGERLRGPALTDPTLEVLAADGSPAPGRAEEVLPVILPDVFRGGSLVVLGRYRGEDPFTLSLAGGSAAGRRAMKVDVEPKGASTNNAFIPRLWASRRIAVLIDEIRQQGLDQANGGVNNPNDPRWRELAGEIVRLSTTYGILTEYTSMLALEGSSFNDLRALEVGCLDALRGRAVATRTGAGAVSQGDNWNRQKLESVQARTTSYVAANGQQIEASNMSQCADKTFYKIGNAWNDASLAGRTPTIDEEVDYGSERHRQILWELVEEGRQSSLALDGDVILRHKGRTILVRKC